MRGVSNVNVKKLQLYVVPIAVLLSSALQLYPVELYFWYLLRNLLGAMLAALLLPAASGLLLPAAPPTGSAANVMFVVPESADKLSSFGATSPEPSPPWKKVAEHLASRLPGFDARIRSSVISEHELSVDALQKADVLVALGVGPSAAGTLRQAASPAALIAHGCAEQVADLQRVGGFQKNAEGLASAVQAAQASVAPWLDAARGKRLSEQADLLLSRDSSEDMLYAIFFVLHAYVLEMSIVRHTVNPTYEKGALQNAAEFASMCTKCGDKIGVALSDPETKATIDLLNACDMRDQVGSYRVIVSYETPQLEEFSLCILQQNNCFGCSAEILETPRVPLMRRWRGATVDDAAARQLFIGHFDCAEAHPQASQRLPWSWKIVCGANPAYALALPQRPRSCRIAWLWPRLRTTCTAPACAASHALVHALVHALAHALALAGTTRSRRSTRSSTRRRSRAVPCGTTLSSRWRRSMAARYGASGTTSAYPAPSRLTSWERAAHPLARGRLRHSTMV